jgi:putative hydrolase of the HAD superfamily
MNSPNTKHARDRKNSDTWVILDLDDTLVDTSDVYYMARETFLEQMVSLRFPRIQVLETFERIETKNINQLGIFPERYSQSMAEAYHLLCAKRKIQPLKKMEELIGKTGRIVIQTVPKPLPGAFPLLRWLNSHYFVVLVSRGDDYYQRKKVKAAGLDPYFHRLFIVQEKTSSTLKKIARSLGRDIGSSWVIGDSIKSDVNPGIKAGARCILYEYRHKRYYWRQEYGEEPEGEYFLAKKLADIKKIIECPEKWPKQRSRLYRKHRRADTRS